MPHFLCPRCSSRYRIDKSGTYDCRNCGHRFYAELAPQAPAKKEEIVAKPPAQPPTPTPKPRPRGRKREPESSARRPPAVSTILSVSAIIVAGVSFLTLLLPCFWFLALPIGGLAFMLGIVACCTARRRYWMPIFATFIGAAVALVSGVLVFSAQIELSNALQRLQNIGR
jgi:hypothetical protein